MKKVVVEKHVGCVAFAAKIVGDKWNPLILRSLCDGPTRFSALREDLQVNPRTLSARLEFLGEHGIVLRTAHAEVPPRVEYELTKKGQDLIPILKKMAEWGERYR